MHLLDFFNLAEVSNRCSHKLVGSTMDPNQHTSLKFSVRVIAEYLHIQKPRFIKYSVRDILYTN